MCLLSLSLSLSVCAVTSGLKMLRYLESFLQSVLLILQNPQITNVASELSLSKSNL